VIVNGGFQEKPLIEEALNSDSCDMVSMARALIANPNLIEQFSQGKDAPDRPCTYCNKCVGRTPTSPLGCYDLSRFPSQRAMLDQIMEWNRPDPA
jgi:2,4-dienoyl-CoA reductase-like NADH-dependent reductase (Old Yellow Enzyme family)